MTGSLEFTVFNLKDCFFGAIKLTKNNDPDKFSHSRNDLLEKCLLDY